MFKKIKEIDKDVIKLIKIMLKGCFIICIVASFILSFGTYEIGYCLFQLGLILAVETIISGLIIDKIKKQF